MGSWKCKRVAKKLFFRTCSSFCHDPAGGAVDISLSNFTGKSKGGICSQKNPLEISGSANPSISPGNKSLCTICLDPLNYSSGGSPGQAIFTAQCSHAFHFGCISSNVQHGSITCPICRAEWTQLPRNLHFRGSTPSIKADPVLQILDDSIANSRLHRRSFLRSARYDDDDPVDSDSTNDQPRFQFSVTGPWNHHNCCVSTDSREGSGHCSGSSSRAGSPLAVKDFWGEAPFLCSPSNVAYLRVKLGYRPSTDLVLVACPDGPHLRMMKQAMALAVFSLDSGDRLAIVTHSSSAARVFPLRRMTPLGKKTALQVIDRLFYCGQADPNEGLQKGVKILTDRIHMNSQSCILHLTNSSTRSYHLPAMAMVDDQISIHRFHLASGFGASMGLTMQEFEESLRQMLSGTIRDVQLRIEESCRIFKITELRGGEEQQFAIYGHECWPLHISYSYVDTADGGRVTMGETLVGFGDEGSENVDVAAVTSRISSGENWEYYDPFMARRWAKHLHGLNRL